MEMDEVFTRLSWWLWRKKDLESSVSGNPNLNSQEIGLREMDSVKFPSAKGAKIPTSSRKTRRKWHSREERRIDREFDLVLVPSDGGCISGSDSEDSDWSIGWLEPHGPDFLSDDESENSFAVLVPCYGNLRNHVVESSKNQLWGAIMSNLPNGYSAESKKYMEQWLSSLQEL